MTSQFNITSASVRGHSCASNLQLLPRNVERVIFSVYVGPMLCYLFQLQNKQREHLLTGKKKPKPIPRAEETLSNIVQVSQIMHYSQVNFSPVGNKELWKKILSDTHIMCFHPTYTSWHNSKGWECYLYPSRKLTNARNYLKKIKSKVKSSFSCQKSGSTY